jgi:hypothetical protein
MGIGMVTGRPGAPPRYLLSGLLKCGAITTDGKRCGYNYVMQDYYRYGCSARINRGRHVCSNSLRVAREKIETKVLDALKRDLFTPIHLELFKKEAGRLLAARQRQQGPERKHVEKRLAEIHRIISNFMRVIGQGTFTVAMKLELESAEAEKIRLEERLRAGQEAESKLLAILPQAEERYRTLVENLSPYSRAVCS